MLKIADTQLNYIKHCQYVHCYTEPKNKKSDGENSGVFLKAERRFRITRCLRIEQIQGDPNMFAVREKIND